jgi:biotin-dependent carboxylase-like uncharacterized protein
MQHWISFRVRPGDELRMDVARSGCRSYLAVQGGIDVPEVLGSRSTYTRAGIGGFEGRALKPGDVLTAGSNFDVSVKPQRLEKKYVPKYGDSIELRVMPGPQNDHFTAAGIDTFFASAFTISAEADRMGYRLDGPRIEHRGEPEIISDALALGSIQVPGHGRPIVLMADRQTTGGYPKIATVIGPDLGRLAHGRPGDSVRFVKCGEDEALDALRRERDMFKEIAREIKKFMYRFEIMIDGVKYDAEVRER